jgi:hypothetical protein
LKSDITNMASDNTLNTEEVTVLNTLVAEIQSRNAEIISSSTAYGLSSTGSYTDYINSYSAWNSLPPVPSNPLPVNFAAVWNDLLDKEALILGAIRTSGQTLLNTLNGDVTAIQNTVDDMAADNKITPQEKIALKREYERVKSEYSKLTVLAGSLGHTSASEYTTLTSSYTALVTLIDTTLSVFASMSASTTIPDVAAWNTAWDNYYLDAKSFDNYVDTAFKGDLDGFSTSLSTITSSVDDMAADGIINGGSEKRLMRQHWDDITNQDTIIRAHATTFGVTLPSGYTTAYNDLNTYINTTLNVFNAMDTDTPVDRAVMEAFFTAYRNEYNLLSQSVATAQANSIATSEPANYTEFTDTVDSIVSDGIISAGAEKQRLNALWADIQATHATFVAQATEAGVSTSNLQNRYGELQFYLNGLTSPTGSTPNFTITNQDSAIGSTAFYQYFRNYEAAKAMSSEGIINSMLATVRESVQTVADMNNDGVISAIEKTTLKRIWDKYTIEKDNAVTQATNLSITTEKNAMTTAYSALDTFLSALDSGAGIFNDMANSTNLTSTEQNQWDGKWFDFETKIQACLTAIQSTQVANTLSVSADAFRHDGQTAASGNFDMATFKITQMANGAVVSGGKEAITGGQLYAEQIARANAVTAEATARTTAISAETSARTTAIAAETSARNTAITNHSNATSVHGVTGDVVGTDDQQTLIGKIMNMQSPASSGGNTLQNIPFSALQSSMIDTDLTTVSNSHDTLASAKAIKTMIDNIPSVDFEWVSVGNIANNNTGTGDIKVAEGTLTLPAGKKWKWVKLVFMCRPRGGANVDKPHKIVVNNSDDTSSFVWARLNAQTTTHVCEHVTWSAEGLPSVDDQNITVALHTTAAGDSPTDLTYGGRDGYLVGIAASDVSGGSGAGGAGGLGGTVDLEWVVKKNAETTNSGTGVVYAEGTLNLPAGKKWKWVRIVGTDRVWYEHDSHLDPIDKIEINNVDRTSDFAIASNLTGLDSADDSDKMFFVAEGYIQDDSSNLDIEVSSTNYINTSGSQRSCFFVGLAAGDPSAVEDYGVYAHQAYAQAATSDVTSPLIGTRMDITDAAYSSSSFNLTLDISILDDGSSASPQAYDIKTASGAYSGFHGRMTGFIKKKSGQDPYVRLTYIAHDTGLQINSQVILYGTLGSGGQKLSVSGLVDALWSDVEIERVDSSNELCFRVSFGGRWNQQATLNSVIHACLQGTRNYLGAAVSSSNGTTF